MVHESLGIHPSWGLKIYHVGISQMLSNKYGDVQYLSIVD